MAQLLPAQKVFAVAEGALLHVAVARPQRHHQRVRVRLKLEVDVKSLHRASAIVIVYVAQTRAVQLRLREVAT